MKVNLRSLTVTRKVIAPVVLALAETEQDQQKALQDLGGRMMAVIDKYAKDNGFVLVLDVSSPQTPVLFASNSIEITKEIVDLYDKAAASAVPATTTSTT